MAVSFMTYRPSERLLWASGGVRFGGEEFRDQLGNNVGVAEAMGRFVGKQGREVEKCGDQEVLM